MCIHKTKHGSPVSAGTSTGEDTTLAAAGSTARPLDTVADDEH